MANDFGIPGVKESCYFIDNRLQAEEFRKQLLRKIMSLYYVGSNGKLLINIIIVGGGATGVELVAELNHSIYKAGHFGLSISANEISFILIESSSRLLSNLTNKISEEVANKLAAINIQVLLNERVVQVTQQGLTTESGKFFNSNLIIWTAGIKAPDFLNNIGGLETNKLNQLIVKPTLQTTIDPMIFALGDCASCKQSDGKLVPPRAQAAHQQAMDP